MEKRSDLIVLPEVLEQHFVGVRMLFHLKSILWQFPSKQLKKESLQDPSAECSIMWKKLLDYLAIKVKAKNSNTCRLVLKYLCSSVANRPYPLTNVSSSTLG